MWPFGLSGADLTQPYQRTKSPNRLLDHGFWRTNGRNITIPFNTLIGDIRNFVKVRISKIRLFPIMTLNH